MECNSWEEEDLSSSFDPTSEKDCYSDDHDVWEDDEEEEEPPTQEAKEELPEKEELRTVSWGHLSEWAETLPDMLAQLACYRAKFIPSLEDEGTPSRTVCDVDGVCLVGYPSKPLSFLRNPLPNDEDVHVYASPSAAAKFSAGRHVLRLGTSGAKYGSGEKSRELDVFHHGKVFHCFARWMSWPLYFSTDEEGDVEEYWRTVIIPSLSKALPLQTFHPEGQLPSEKHGLNAREFATFVREMSRSSSGEDGNERWTHVQTLSFKVGQKLEPFDASPESFYRETLKKTMDNFDMEGVDFMFWSTGCNIRVPWDHPQRIPGVHLASFWKKSFLEDQLQGARRSYEFYTLMGSGDLASARSKGAPPEGFVRSSKQLAKLAKANGVIFEAETWQFYSTWIYLFKDKKGENNYPCNPYSAKWRSRSSSVGWLKGAMGMGETTRGQGNVDPLTEATKALEDLNPRADSPLRVEPTFFLRFRHGSSENEREEALESLANASSEKLRTVYSEFCTDDELDVHTTTSQKRCLVWLKTLCTLYRHVVLRIERDAKERGYATPQEREVIDYLEYSPFYWLTGKLWNVSPKVHASLGMYEAVRNCKAPMLPRILVREGVSSAYSDLIGSKPSSPEKLPNEHGSKWLPSDSTLGRLPQVWFLARELPWARKMKQELALLFEFWVKLSTPRVVTEDALVDDLLTIFGYCCLVRSKVKPLEKIMERRKTDGATPSRTICLAEVRTLLSERLGPLYSDPEDLQERAVANPLPLTDLLVNLFGKENVLEPRYKKNASDVWVAALRFLKNATDPKNGSLKRKIPFFGPSSSLVTAVSKRWSHVLGFVNFWKCTENKFAKMELGVFPTTSHTVDPDETPPSGTSEVDATTYDNTRLKDIRDGLRAQISKALRKVDKKAADPFVGDALLLEVLNASALARFSFDRFDTKPGEAFGILCFARLVRFLERETKKDTYVGGAMQKVIAYYAKKMPVHTVSCNDLAEHASWCFKMKGKVLAIPHDYKALVQLVKEKSRAYHEMLGTKIK